MSKLFYKESIMNFLFLSIVSCLLLSHTNYATPKPKKTGWKYSWPIATAVRRIATSLVASTPQQPHENNSIPKNLSRNTLQNVNDEHFWTTVEQDGVIDLNHVDSTLIKDYYQDATATSQTSITQHSPNRKPTESVSAIHSDPFVICGDMPNNNVSVAAHQFAQTIESKTETITSGEKQTTTGRLCGCCCFKKDRN